MDTTPNKTVGALLEKMVSTDTDYRFMGINDLINELQADSLRLDAQSEKKVVNLVLHLLRDPSGEVQGLAVKSLGPLTNKVKEQLVSAIVKDLIVTMDKGSDEQLRGVCSIGLKTVINSLPATNDARAIMNECLVPLMHMAVSHTDDNVRIEACEVLGELINHLGNRLTAHHRDLLDCMLCNLSSQQNTLRKRATQALGGLAWIVSPDLLASLFVYLLSRLRNASLFVSSSGKGLSDEQVTAMVTDHPLLQRPLLIDQLKQSASSELVKTMLQCLNLISRQLLRTPQQIQPVTQLLAWILQQPGSAGAVDMDDVHELAIQSLETVVRCCPRVILPNLPELVALLCDRLQYDPNYDYNVGEDDMTVDNSDSEGEDEEADYSDDEDYSWKVRRAAARALEAVVLTYPEKTADFYQSIAPLLIKRFNDHEEPVRSNIFSCFATLLRQTRITPSASSVPFHSQPKVIESYNYQHMNYSQLHTRTTSPDCSISHACLHELAAQLKDPESAQSRLLALLPTICQAIQRQASVTSRRAAASRGTPGIQHVAFMLNRDLALALPGHLGEHLNSIFTLIHTYSQDPTTNNTVKIDMVNLVVLLLGTHNPVCFKSNLNLLVQLALWAMHDPFYRVALEGLELTQLLSCYLRQLGQEGQTQTLLVPLYTLLEANDRDLELKEKAVTSAAVFINQLGDLIGADRLEQCLEVLYRRLTNELTRLTTVRAIHIISVSPFTLNLRQFLPKASDELATFLSKNDRLLRLATLRCLYTIWSKHPGLVGPHCLDTVFEVLPKLLTSEQDQLAIHLVSLLLESFSADHNGLDDRITQFITTNAFVQPVIGLAHSPLLRGQALGAMLRLMRAIGRRAIRNGQEQGGIMTLFLSRLLAPLNGSGLLVVSGSTSSVLLHRDALPSLAQCVAELLAELPTVSSSGKAASSVASVGVAVDRLIAAVRNADSSVTQIYLNLLILGELGRKVDLSDRKDLREIFISTLSAQPSHTSSIPGGPVLANGVSVIEEVRPAAALALGRLVVGQPQSLLPILVARISEVASAHTTTTQGDPSGVGHQHQLYHMLQALREVLVHLAGYSTSVLLKKHLDDIWCLLMASSGLPEEGTRLVVAECLGRLILVSPRDLINRLRRQLTSPEASCPLVRCTLVTAIRSILIATDLDTNSHHPMLSGQSRLDSFDWATIGLLPSGLLLSTVASSPLQQHESDDPEKTTRTAVLLEVDSILRSEQPPPLLDFLSRLADPDILVRRASLMALNTAAHHRPGLVRPLLNMPLDLSGHVTTLLKLLYGETVVRPELIREVEMGPFKRKEDDGLDLRKCAFECMFTLLENCLDKLVMSDFLDPLIKGLKDHTDIQLLSYQILQHVACVRPLEIAAKMEALSVPLKAVLLSKPKEDWVKQELEKQQELSRAAVAAIVQFKSIENIDKNRSYLDLLRTIETEPALKSMYTTMAAQDTPASFSRKIPGTAPSYAYNP
ncbi:Cullin-associated NEDD8-dissociated protein 1 [Clonorchis sinensis]|uniref:Cullin-associated NEDD8-dissociated protein 1 n=1 Tax=Clonorchis sinensis TaxID=79923 RepID=A0A8T1LX88_CLOSI|nr:Cullin-associated NEDD8-dissociated protein 1 [Clonorchis sinensis]